MKWTIVSCHRFSEAHPSFWPMLTPLLRNCRLRGGPKNCFRPPCLQVGRSGMRRRRRRARETRTQNRESRMQKPGNKETQKTRNRETSNPQTWKLGNPETRKPETKDQKPALRNQKPAHRTQQPAPSIQPSETHTFQTLPVSPWNPLQ